MRRVAFIPPQTERETKLGFSLGPAAKKTKCKHSLSALEWGKMITSQLPHRSGEGSSTPSVGTEGERERDYRVAMIMAMMGRGKEEFRLGDDTQHYSKTGGMVGSDVLAMMPLKMKLAEGIPCTQGILPSHTVVRWTKT